MFAFQRILVAVDFGTEGDYPDSTRQASDQALWLAQQSKGQVTFFHVIKASPEIQEQMLRNQASPARDYFLRVEARLDESVSQAREKGVEAHRRIAFGRDWQETVREVCREKHEIVLLGTRNRNLASRTLFGSFGMKLLRNCPCPVWIIKSSTSLNPKSIFVAHDLTEVGSEALQLAASLAQSTGAQLHVLHVLEHPEFEAFLPTMAAQVVEERRQAGFAQIDGELANFRLAAPARIKIEDGTPYVEIINYLNRHPADLVVMGTVARAGLAGVLTGNTAENLLPWIPCSIITLKPGAFVCPVPVA